MHSLGRGKSSRGRACWPRGSVGLAWDTSGWWCGGREECGGGCPPPAPPPPAPAPPPLSERVRVTPGPPPDVGRFGPEAVLEAVAGEVWGAKGKAAEDGGGRDPEPLGQGTHQDIIHVTIS